MFPMILGIGGTPFDSRESIKPCRAISRNYARTSAVWQIAPIVTISKPLSLNSFIAAR
jgi:hypothetical protein